MMVVEVRKATAYTEATTKENHHKDQDNMVTAYNGRGALSQQPQNATFTFSGQHNYMSSYDSCPYHYACHYYSPTN